MKVFFLPLLQVCKQITPTMCILALCCDAVNAILTQSMHGWGFFYVPIYRIKRGTVSIWVLANENSLWRSKNTFTHGNTLQWKAFCWKLELQAKFLRTCICPKVLSHTTDFYDICVTKLVLSSNVQEHFEDHGMRIIKGSLVIRQWSILQSQQRAILLYIAM